MELGVYHKDGTSTERTVTLDPAVYAVEPNNHVLWLDVRRTQASRRQGTHKTKERSEVSGSGRKLYRQKGTGMARSGAVVSPLRRGGGRTFGPIPRSYTVRLSKKTKQLARRSALSYKVKDDAIRVVEPLAFERPSTRGLLGVLDALEVSKRPVLVITATNAPAVHMSSRNAPKVAVREARNVSAEDILRAGIIVMEEEATNVLAAVLGGDSTTSSTE